MTIEKSIRTLAGTMVPISIGLSHYVNVNWLWLGVFAGLNLIQSSFTGFCPAEMIFKKMGLKA